jgi:hypothetical protein
VNNIDDSDISEPSRSKSRGRSGGRNKKIIDDSESEMSRSKSRKRDEDIDSEEMALIEEQFKEIEESEKRGGRYDLF